VGLETDISKCFDQIAHQPLLKKLNTSPSIARQIRAWLKAGMIDNFHYCETSQGVPQGGCLSPNGKCSTTRNRTAYCPHQGAKVTYADDLSSSQPQGNPAGATSSF